MFHAKKKAENYAASISVLELSLNILIRPYMYRIYPKCTLCVF